MTVPETTSDAPYILRTHQPGDIGHIISRHGVVYGEEFGWDIRSEVVAARVAADVIANMTPQRERFFIAERRGTSEFLGCVGLMQDPKDPKTALLRLLLVEKEARGMGLGSKMIDECISLARANGCSKIKLWTYSKLEGARRLYARAGFRCLEKQAEKEEYSQMLTKEFWELVL